MDRPWGTLYKESELAGKCPTTEVTGSARRTTSQEGTGLLLTHLHPGGAGVLSGHSFHHPAHLGLCPLRPEVPSELTVCPVHRTPSGLCSPSRVILCTETLVSSLPSSGSSKPFSAFHRCCFHLFCSTCPTRVRRLVQPTSPPCHRNTARPYFFKLLTFGTAATRGQTKPQPGKLLKGKRSSLRCDRRAVG